MIFHHLNNKHDFSQNKYLIIKTILTFVKCYMVGRESVLGMDTLYKVGGQRDRIALEPRFSSPVLTFLVVHPASCKRVPGFFHEAKAAGAWHWPPTPI